MTPLERAARALCVLDGNDPDRSVMLRAFQTSVRTDMRRPGEGPFAWQNYLPQARAVLKAIREPSEAMEVAALDLGADNSAPEYWRSMIGAALEEG